MIFKDIHGRAKRKPILTDRSPQWLSIPQTIIKINALLSMLPGCFDITIRREMLGAEPAWEDITMKDLTTMLGTLGRKYFESKNSFILNLSIFPQTAFVDCQILRHSYAPSMITPSLCKAPSKSTRHICRLLPSILSSSVREFIFQL